MRAMDTARMVINFMNKIVRFMKKSEVPGNAATTQPWFGHVKLRRQG